MTVNRLGAELCAVSVADRFASAKCGRDGLNLAAPVSALRRIFARTGGRNRIAACFSGIRREVDFAVFPIGALGESRVVEVFSKRFCRIAARRGPESAGVLRSDAAWLRPLIRSAAGVLVRGLLVR
ncbi:hypothetical protein IFM12275_19480 [Nocardia sputorum]|nr:hypothetical protein IFM12275_19480 [Nocardia sputorum]